MFRMKQIIIYKFHDIFNIQTDNETISENITETEQKSEVELKEIEANVEDDRLKRVEVG